MTLRAPRPPWTALSVMEGVRRIDLDRASVHYRLVRSRRRTIAIHVGHYGVEARAPVSVSLSDVESFMRQKERWIMGRLEDAAQTRLFVWEAGARLPLLGGHVTLVDAPQRRGIAVEGDQLLIGRVRANANGDWRKRITAWIREQALAWFVERSSLLAARLGVTAPVVRLSNAGARWGSCTVYPTEARIRLHWKLYLLQPHLIDYVVAHELAHIRELNHSSRFWAQVARLCPDYAAARKELNRRGRALPVL
jgi:predicted metal-dependent hydrolase